MALTLITPPAAPVVALDELQQHLRLYPCGSPPETPDDALIQRLAEIAVSELDGVDGWLGRALIDQSWYLTLPEFPQYIRPVYGLHWPAARCQADAVRVQYSAGYGAAGADMPAVIRGYLLLRVGQLYEYRELVGAAAAVAPVPYMRDMLESVRQRRRSCVQDD